MKTFVKAQNLKKSYDTGKVVINALNGIDFEINEGEFAVILGQSGAGKTTLLNIIGGMDSITSGDLFVDGINLNGMSNKNLTTYRRHDVGFVFQFHQLLPEFSALENVMLPALIGKTPQAKAEARAKELLDFLNLSDRLKHKPAQLSGGEKQRVAVARALINNPDIVFADEPSGSLDTLQKEELHSLFFKLRSQMGQTFVIVTHDMAFARSTDRVIYMKDGVVDSSSSLLL